MVVTMMIISTGPMMIPQNPNMAMPENTASSMSAGSSRAALGTNNRAQHIVDVGHHQYVPDH